LQRHHQGRRPLAMGLPGKAGNLTVFLVSDAARSPGGRTGVRSGNMNSHGSLAPLRRIVQGQVLKGRIAFPTSTAHRSFRADVKGRQSATLANLNLHGFAGTSPRSPTPVLRARRKLRKAPSGYLARATKTWRQSAERTGAFVPHGCRVSRHGILKVR